MPNEETFSQFKAWLDEQFSHDHAGYMVKLAQENWQMISDPSRLHTLSPGRRSYVMRALANFAKFTGQYEQWREGLRANRVSWGGRKAVDVFRAILEEEGSDEKGQEWLNDAIPRLPRPFAFILIFQRLTGLRIEEACYAVSLLARGKKDEYYDNELMMLRHFKYPDMFLRRSKNTFISFVSPTLMDACLKFGVAYTKDGLHSAMHRAKVPEHTKLSRKGFATQMRLAGIPRESIDLVQGRIPASVFSQHYYRPGLKALSDQVVRTIKPLQSELLESIA